MIIHKQKKFKSKVFDHVLSDRALMIKRNDGVEMVEDMQLPGTYTYEETDKSIYEEQIDYKEFVAILLGEA